MTRNIFRLTIIGALFGVLPGVAGCGGSGDADSSADSASTGEPQDAQVELGQSADLDAGSEPRFQKITLTGGKDSAGSSKPKLSPEENMVAVREKLKPLQVMVGQWQGITRRAIGGAKAVDEPEWIWDFKTDKFQPALLMKSETGPYVKEGRLTYLTDKEKYQFTVTGKVGDKRVYEGTFSEPVRDVAGDDNTVHRTFKLKLIQVEPPDARKMAEIVFNQQENNRYLMEVYDRRGTALARYDTVGTQRQGTSFAVSDTDYGERTCIISQGLGTMTVSYEGKTYYVCCGGCKAAFEEDPEYWVAKLEENK